MIKKIMLTCIMLSLAMTAYANKVNSKPIYTKANTVIQVSSKNPEFVIKLKSNRTTGYAWFLKSYDTSFVTPLKHTYVAPTSQLVGASGYELWTFRIKANALSMPKHSTLDFVYARVWEASNTGQTEHFVISTVHDAN